MDLFRARQRHRHRSSTFRPHLRPLPAPSWKGRIFRHRHGSCDLQKNCRTSSRAYLCRVGTGERIYLLFHNSRRRLGKFACGRHALRSNVMENSKSEAIRVLLVEDNFAEARLIQETLKELQTADFRIIHVDRLQKALERLSQNEIDVILLDLSLPDAQGLETVERTLTAAPHLPVVVLTGLDDEIIAANAVRAGAQDYLVKGQAYS